MGSCASSGAGSSARARLSDAQVDELKHRADLAGLVERFGGRLRKSGRKLIGSCPLCGGGKSATRFEIKADGESWVCAVCADGGDAIKLVEKARRCSFRDAVEFLGGPAQLDPQEEQRLARERKAREERKAALAEHYRRQSIAGAMRIWNDADFIKRDPLTAYLRARGISGLPQTADIRLGRAVAYFHGEKIGATGKREPVVLFRGPAMVGAIRDNSGAIIGAHLTYLKPDFSGKAKVVDPESGADLPAKKMRGAKEGGHIVLRWPPAPERLFIAEGIETALSVATALRACGRLRPGDAFWAAGDLGNLGGPHVEAVKHPTLKTSGGHALRVPGPQPDFDRAGIEIPPFIRELVLLGDGDSDAFTTQMALKRAAARYARAQLTVRIAMAPAGKDFNDVLTSRERSDRASEDARSSEQAMAGASAHRMGDAA